MTQMQWLVEQSLMRDARFRHLTVMPEADQEMNDINELLASGDSLDNAEGMALLYLKISKIEAENY